MGFREDREAVGQRADALERELADARSELQRAQMKSAIEIDELKKRLDQRAAPTDEPVWRRWGGTIALFSLVSLMAGGVYMMRVDRERSRIAMAEERELLQLQDRLSSLINEVHAAEAERDRAREELRLAQADHDADLREAVGGMRGIAIIGAFAQETNGFSPVTPQQQCSLSLTWTAGRCDGELTCGAAPIAGGELASLECQMRDGSPWNPALAPAPDAAIGPELRYDGQTRSLELHVNRPPMPEWTARFETRTPVTRTLR